MHSDFILHWISYMWCDFNNNSNTYALYSAFHDTHFHSKLEERYFMPGKKDSMLMNHDSVCVCLFIGLCTAFQAAMQHAYQIWWALMWNESYQLPTGMKGLACYLVTPTASKYSLFVSLFVKWGKLGSQVDATKLLICLWNPVLPTSLPAVLMDQVSRGEQEGAGSICEKSFQQVGEKRYKPLSESWYWLNPLTVYTFTSASLSATQ